MLTSLCLFSFVAKNNNLFTAATRMDITIAIENTTITDILIVTSPFIKVMTLSQFYKFLFSYFLHEYRKIKTISKSYKLLILVCKLKLIY